MDNQRPPTGDLRRLNLIRNNYVMLTRMKAMSKISPQQSYGFTDE
jgi:hypothetical protein